MSIKNVSFCIQPLFTLQTVDHVDVLMLLNLFCVYTRLRAVRAIIEDTRIMEIEDRSCHSTIAYTFVPLIASPGVRLDEPPARDYCYAMQM